MGACLFAGALGARTSYGDAGRNPVAAQALYDEARRLVDAGKLAEACPKFKASYDLDPGGGTLLNLADCYEKDGKLALAWSTFKDALVAAQRDGRNERVDYASQHIAKLEPRLARLTVKVAAEARAAGTTVLIDGTPLAEPGWGVTMPVDPGKHVVRAEAPGKIPFEATVEVSAGAGAGQQVEVPPLADAEGSVANTKNVDAPATAPATSPSSSRRTLGWVVGGVGVVSLGVGSYFGLRAFSRWSDREDACVGGCTPAAKSAGDEASSAATLSTIGFGVGLVAVGVGTYLVLAGGGEQQHAQVPAPRLRVLPMAARDGGGLLLRSAW